MILQADSHDDRVKHYKNKFLWLKKESSRTYFPWGWLRGLYWVNFLIMFWKNTEWNIWLWLYERKYDEGTWTTVWGREGDQAVIIFHVVFSRSEWHEGGELFRFNLLFSFRFHRDFISFYKAVHSLPITVVIFFSLLYHPRYNPFFNGKIIFIWVILKMEQESRRQFFVSKADHFPRLPLVIL